jgi:phage-related protein
MGKALGGPDEKPVIWEHGEVKSPPFSPEARQEAGILLGLLQGGELIGMPHSRPMPVIGPGCHELRVRDRGHLWRIMYRIDSDSIVVVGVFDKSTRSTPKQVIDLCRCRLDRYDRKVREASRPDPKESRKGGR